MGPQLRQHALLLKQISTRSANMHMPTCDRRLDRVSHCRCNVCECECDPHLRV